MMFCAATAVISYALVLTDIPTDSVIMKQTTLLCYAIKMDCKNAAFAINMALGIEGPQRKIASCIVQPSKEIK